MFMPEPAHRCHKKESYRSGHNELHSKCSCPLLGTWVRIPHSPPDAYVHKRVCRLWAFFIPPFFWGVNPQFSPKMGEFSPKNVSFSCKKCLYSNSALCIGVSSDMIRRFLMRLLPMPHLSLLPLHPQRTAWNYSPDGHIHWRLWRSHCDRAIPVSASSVRRLRAAAKRSCVGKNPNVWIL